MHPKSNSSLINSIYITDELQKVYYNADERTRNIKSAFVGLCSDIDRFFRLRFDIDIHTSVSDAVLEKVLEVFPSLSGLTIDLFKKILSTFYALRNVNSHLFLNHCILLNKELEDFLTSKAQPMYAITKKHRLTLYGSFYFLTFLSQKYQLWTFITSCFQKDFFDDISVEDLSPFQIRIQHHHQLFCGNGKPILAEKIENKKDSLFLNDTCKRNMTKIFFDLEKALNTKKTPRKKADYFSKDLKRKKSIFQSDNLINDIIDLRNCWFHGSFLFDTVTTNDQRTFEFNLSFIIRILNNLSCCICTNSQFKKLRSDINSFGSSLLDFYVLKLVEVSYKIIDNRLLNAEKFPSRINDLSRAFQCFAQNSPSFYEEISTILNKKKRWELSPFKFTDKIPRRICSYPLRIIQLYSRTGFDIGDYHTDQSTLSIALVDLDKQYQNQINGKYLSDFKYISQSFYSENICVCIQSE